MTSDLKLNSASQYVYTKSMRWNHFHAMKMIKMQSTASVKQLLVYKMTMVGLEHISFIN